jgi:hypothetical protein
MNQTFDEIIYDITQLIGYFPKEKLKVFLSRRHGIREGSTSRGLVRAEHNVGTEPLLKEIFDYFYPKGFIVIDDLYEICTNAAIERRCHFSFVPYRVRVFAKSKTTPTKKTGIRLKGKRIYIDDSEKMVINIPNPQKFIKDVGAKRLKLKKHLKSGDIFIVYDGARVTSPKKGVEIIYYSDIAHRVK